MPLNALHHVSICTKNLEQTRDFYVDVLGMEEGERPPFDFPGNWLYVGNEAVVHLIGLEGNNAGLVRHMGERDLENLQGTGAIDHVAFNITEPEALLKRIEAQAIPYRQREVPGMALVQFFLEDPNGVTIELNCWTNH